MVGVVTPGWAGRIDDGRSDFFLGMWFPAGSTCAREFLELAQQDLAAEDSRGVTAQVGQWKWF